jgi:hypothetical protein
MFLDDVVKLTDDEIKLMVRACKFQDYHGKESIPHFMKFWNAEFSNLPKLP